MFRKYAIKESVLQLLVFITTVKVSVSILPISMDN